ncbi:MAG: hypothetical protein PHW60_07305 [Kiritimatiellae bacterium]|nr:hypothetical protein [Kiritimatiellia bacterium]
MDAKSIIKRGLLFTVGYLLSPLSWWNDLYVNLPIAYGLAWLVSLMGRQYFTMALVGFYWLSNIAGLILVHKGLAPSAVNGVPLVKKRLKNMLTDLVISVVYTGVIVLFIYWGLLKLPQEY